VTTTCPIALVYRGPASCSGCSEAVAALLKSSQCNFDVRYVGPKESLSVQAGLKLPNAKVFAQPGGPSVSKAFSKLKADAPAVRNFVSNGGRYLGFCLGAYLVDNDPGYGFGIDTYQYIRTQGATINHTRDTIVKTYWSGQQRYMFFQDGNFFYPQSKLNVLATYTNGQIAAMVAPYGLGKVGGVGPHPEADASWYSTYRLTDPDGLDADLGHRLIDATMQP
jgi:glutamine amidotransferase-like uncharacterized protein